MRSPLTLALLVIAAFLLGGSPRPEVVTLSFLRGGAAVFFVLGLTRLPLNRIKPFRLLVVISIGCLLIPVGQLIPLPPDIVEDLPSHKVIRLIDATAGLDPVWCPLTLTPDATRNALWALLVPIAVLTWAIRLPSRQHKTLAFCVFGIGMISALVGLLQLLGDANGPLYFYETTNNGSAVGLFANRNHQAAFLACLLPLALALAKAPSDHKVRKPYRKVLLMDARAAIALTSILFIVPLILVTGSRSGLALGALGLVCAPLVMASQPASQSDRVRMKRSWILALLCVAAGALVTLSLWLQRANAIDRLLDQSSADEMRFLIIPTMREMIETYWPWGSGLGSFEKVYQVHEPANLLAPFYMNHAHNDWLELIMTGGLPAVIIMFTGCAAWLYACARQIFAKARDDLQPLRTAGLVILLILGLASLTDYPLRTPALSCLFALAAVWAVLPRGADMLETASSKAD